MSRSKAEIRAFCDSKVGSVVSHPGYSALNGQCVTWIKALMEFLGVPSPYMARGNAIDVGDTLIRQGIGTPGRGWLTIVINRDMGYIDGVHYGHVWVDLQGQANYESNGAIPLHVTRNTRPISQGQQFVNFDKWVSEGNGIMNEEDAKEGYRSMLHREPENDQVWRGWVGKRLTDMSKAVRGSQEWLTQNHAIAFFGQREQQLNQAQVQLAQANIALNEALANDATDKAAIAEAQKQAKEALDSLNRVTDEFNAVKQQLDQATADKQEAEITGNAFLRWLGDQLNKIIRKDV